MAALASGHGENIIESRIASKATTETLMNFAITDTKAFLGEAISWDLGLVIAQFDANKRSGQVDVL